MGIAECCCSKDKQSLIAKKEKEDEDAFNKQPSLDIFKGVAKDI
jgi:hypothetical protein